FQAEDGIRDDLVTGVQTCALPIYASSSPGSSGRAVTNRARASSTFQSPVVSMYVIVRYGSHSRSSANRVRMPRPSGGCHQCSARSEERRVGKGGGGGVWRWARQVK